MKSYRDAPVARRWSIDTGAVRRFADRLRESYSIASPSIDTEARLLSGGNLQRLILAREIASQPRLMVAVQPTRGLDVGAIATVHRLLLDQRAAGSATVLISEDLDEVLALSDRVAVIYEGRIVGIVDAADADIAEIGLLMTGGRPSPTIEPTDAHEARPVTAGAPARRPPAPGWPSPGRSAPSDGSRSRAGSRWPRRSAPSSSPSSSAA